MRTPPPPLLPILRSQVQGALALTYLDQESEFSLTELARRSGASLKSVHYEVDRLVEAGLLADRRMGQMRLVRANMSTPLAGPLVDLLAVTYGPLPVLEDSFAGVDGVASAYIYGSWAARYRGEPGPPPADVDVLVVGSADLDVLDDVAREAGGRLHRDVSIRQLRPHTWAAGSDPFVATVRSRPLVEIPVSESNEVPA